MLWEENEELGKVGEGFDLRNKYLKEQNFVRDIGTPTNQ